MDRLHGTVLWIAADKHRIDDSLRNDFLQTGYGVLEATDCLQGLWTAILHRPTLILLHPRLPDGSGTSFLKGLRTTCDIPTYVMETGSRFEPYHRFSNVYPASGILNLYGHARCKPTDAAPLFNSRFFSSSCDVF